MLKRVTFCIITSATFISCNGSNSSEDTAPKEITIVPGEAPTETFLSLTDFEDIDTNEIDKSNLSDHFNATKFYSPFFKDPEVAANQIDTSLFPADCQDALPLDFITVEGGEGSITLSGHSGDITCPFTVEQGGQSIGGSMSIKILVYNKVTCDSVDYSETDTLEEYFAQTFETCASYTSSYNLSAEISTSVSFAGINRLDNIVVKDGSFTAEGEPCSGVIADGIFTANEHCLSKNLFSTTVTGLSDTPTISNILSEKINKDMIAHSLDITKKFATSGNTEISINDWEGTVTYNDNQDPSFTLSNGTETLDGNLSDTGLE